ncbi:hypothetical protein [Streptomyces sp. NPDC001889]
MSETPAWTTYVDGELVELPMTIESVRAQLTDDEERTEFDAQIAQTPAPQLPQVLAAWALPATAWERIDENIGRIKAGERFHPQEPQYATPEVA